MMMMMMTMMMMFGSWLCNAAFGVNGVKCAALLNRNRYPTLTCMGLTSYTTKFAKVTSRRS